MILVEFLYFNILVLGVPGELSSFSFFRTPLITCSSCNSSLHQYIKSREIHHNRTIKLSTVTTKRYVYKTMKNQLNLMILSIQAYPESGTVQIYQIQLYATQIRQEDSSYRRSLCRTFVRLKDVESHRKKSMSSVIPSMLGNGIGVYLMA